MDLTDPLGAYPSLQSEFLRLAQEHFEQLLRASGVDEGQNAVTVGEYRDLESRRNDGRASLMKLRAIQAVSVVLSPILVIWGAIGQGAYFILWVFAVAGPIIAFNTTRPLVRELKEDLSELTTRRDEKHAEASAQMAPLNELHSRGLADTLFQKLIPEVEFSPYLTDRRVEQLHADFGLDRSFPEGRSMLAIKSGSYRCNPFVMARFLQHWIGPWTYQGSIVIHWTERVRNSDGKWETVQRSQTLTATVTKPYPFFSTKTTLIYGHHAVPGLRFSRSPSFLSGLDEGVVNDWLKDRAVKRVERRARRAVSKGSGNFTVMSNTEFEALFRAIDRNDEVDFRVLFTPLAQQRMLEILNDTSLGFGDDFAMTKEGMLTFVEPHHLQRTDMALEPQSFASISVAEARSRFVELNGEYFRSLYFAFSPLWAIPMFHDEPAANVVREPAGSATSSVWEHEVLANAIGDASFRHPSCTTTSILRAASSLRPDGTSAVTVTASGYEGVPRVDIVRMRGGDGETHNVPVHWTEYLPVSRQSSMIVGAVGSDAERTAWQSALEANRVVGAPIRRGDLAAVVVA